MYEYEKDGAEIYRRSFATIRAETDLTGLPEDVARVAVRMVHACGQVDLVDDLAFSPDVVARAREALEAGAGVRGRVGEAECHLFDAARLTGFAVDWLERRFGA